jgi:hypothetical protein
MSINEATFIMIKDSIFQKVPLITPYSQWLNSGNHFDVTGLSACHNFERQVQLAV